MRVECLQDPFSSGMGWGRCRLPGRRAPSGSQSRGWRPLASWYVLIGNHVRTVFRSKKNQSPRTTRQGRDWCFSVKGGLGPTQMVPFEVLPRWPFRGLMLLTGRLYSLQGTCGLPRHQLWGASRVLAPGLYRCYAHRVLEVCAERGSRTFCTTVKTSLLFSSWGPCTRISQSCRCILKTFHMALSGPGTIFSLF